ncbi:hypothetical protein PR048_004564, partial [Dryococelus australis]
MRNRCVEIYMKPMMHILSKVDSHSLLADLGLQSPVILSSVQGKFVLYFQETNTPYNKISRVRKLVELAMQMEGQIEVPISEDSSNVQLISEDSEVIAMMSTISDIQAVVSDVVETEKCSYVKIPWYDSTEGDITVTSKERLNLLIEKESRTVLDIKVKPCAECSKRVLGFNYTSYKRLGSKATQNVPKEARKIGIHCLHSATKKTIKARSIRKRRNDTGEVKRKGGGHDIFLQKGSGETYSVSASQQKIESRHQRKCSEVELKSWSKLNKLNYGSDCILKSPVITAGLLPVRYMWSQPFGFWSELHMFDVYKEWCATNSFILAGSSLFSEIMKEKHIAIHMPRKNQCNVWCSYKVGMVSQIEYDLHIKKKEDARAAKNAAKASTSEEKLVVTMDLQSVLLCPKTLASKLYYKQKLQVHNVTIYMWHEANGGVSANKFTSYVIKVISHQPNEVCYILLISDECNYQDRNKVLSKKSIVIEQLFLEKGHAMMEADSVHAMLDKYFKLPISSLSDYVARMRLARPAKPYKVYVLDYNFFKNCEAVATNFTSLQPGKKSSDPVITDIRALKYLSSSEILYKKDHTADYDMWPQKRRRSTFTACSDPPSLYKQQLSFMEQCWNERVGETGVPQKSCRSAALSSTILTWKNLELTSRSAWWEESSLTPQCVAVDSPHLPFPATAVSSASQERENNWHLLEAGRAIHTSIPLTPTTIHKHEIATARILMTVCLLRKRGREAPEVSMKLGKGNSNDMCMQLVCEVQAPCASCLGRPHTSTHLEIISSDNFGHLTWVAYIASQQAIRGLDMNCALKDTLLDMHSITAGQMPMKDLEEKLDTVFLSQKAFPKTVIDYIDLKAATLKTAALNDQRAACLVKQDCALLTAILVAEQHKSCQLSDLFQIFPNVLGVDCSWMMGCDGWEMLLIFLIVPFFGTSNNSIKTKWVMSLLRDVAGEQCAQNILNNFVKVVCDEEPTELTSDHTMWNSVNWLLMELAFASANHRNLVNQKPSDDTIRIVDASSDSGKS